MKKYFLLSVIHNSVRADLDALSTTWVAPTSDDIRNTLVNFRNAQEDKDNLPDWETLEDVKHAIGYGQHWTAFSSGYGGCTDTLEAPEDSSKCNTT